MSDNQDIEDEPVIKAFNFAQKIKEIQSVQKEEAIKRSSQATIDLKSKPVSESPARINKSVDNNIAEAKIIKVNSAISEQKTSKKFNTITKKAEPLKVETKNIESEIVAPEMSNTEVKEDKVLTEQVAEQTENSNDEQIARRFINPESNELYSFDEMFAIASEEAAQENMEKLSGFDAMILKQAMAKFITSPDMREFSAKAQSIIKAIPDNSNNVLNHLFELPKSEIEKFLQKLYEYNKSIKENKLSPQKLKDCLEFLFRAIQAEFFLKFSD